jgi:hypothetical protein
MQRLDGPQEDDRGEGECLLTTERLDGSRENNTGE